MLFALGLMPAFLILQLALVRPLSRVIWPTLIGFIAYFPYLVIRASFIGNGFVSDYMTFGSNFRIVLVLDFVLPLLYTVLLMLFIMWRKLFKRNYLNNIALFTLFFGSELLVYMLFRTRSYGAYEYLLRPIYYLLLTLLFARLYTKFIWWLWPIMLITMLLGAASSAFFSMNQFSYAFMSGAGMILLSLAGWLLATTRRSFINAYRLGNEE